MTGGIFISYRRDDSAGYAGRLYDRLTARFGGDRVFMDVEGSNPVPTSSSPSRRRWAPARC